MHVESLLQFSVILMNNKSNKFMNETFKVNPDDATLLAYEGHSKSSKTNNKKKTLNMVTKLNRASIVTLFGYHIQSFFLEFVLELFECPSYSSPTTFWEQLDSMATGSVLPALAIRHCWKHLQHPETA